MKRTPDIYLGVDLGASSGRAVVARIDGRRLEMTEVSRFANAPCELGGTLYWNFLSLWGHVLDSMRICAEKGYGQLSGMGVDTWGLDFGLLGADGRLLGNPVCYRDDSTEGIERVLLAAIGKEELYRLTGLPPDRVITLSQLCARKRGGGLDNLRIAQALLMMPDLFRYFLCGHKAVELTSAGSSQLLNIRTRRWCRTIFRKTGLPLRMMPGIVEPPVVVGRLHPRLAAESGLNRVPVIAVAGHDTLSAAAAAPWVDDDCAFLSSGTWSVLGAIRKSPITTAQAMRKGFVNELGVACVLFAKNMMGLYLFENLCRSLARDGKRVSYAQLIRDAAGAKPFSAVLDMSAPLFFTSQDTARSVRQFLRKTGQRTVRTTAAIARLLLEGLALSHRAAAHDLMTLTGNSLRRLCLVGGGSRNALLCQMTADATGLEVVAGPAEATVAGNVALQALATGRLSSHEAIRDMIRNSFSLRTYKPRSSKIWDRQYKHYVELQSAAQILK